MAEQPMVPTPPDRSDSSRCLDNVPVLAWGKNGDCSFLGALEAALTITPFPCDYRTLMGATGLAFRLRWFTGPELLGCPSSAVGEFPDETQAAQNATGWVMRYEGEWDGRPMARLVPDFKATIDRGLPALAYDAELNVAVVFGYEADGRTLLMRTYLQGEVPLRLATADLKMFALFLEEHQTPLTPAEAAKQGIALGVRNWKRRHEPEEDEERGYWHGPLAFQAWRDVIARYDALDNDQRGTAFFLNWWTFENLADARRNAGPYLCQVAPLLPAAAGNALVRAAALYEEETRLLSRAFSEKDVFLGPWSKEDAAAWSAPVRKHELEMLCCAESLEADAMRELSSALAAM